ncbi:MAG: YHYH protein [Rhodothermales bacterium]
MRPHSYVFAIVVALFTLGAFSACDSSTTSGNIDDPTLGEVDPSLFVDAAIVGEITEEACVLSGGTETTCIRFSVNTDPVDHTAGPWCPGTIQADASEGGIWPEGGIAYEVDGSFIENLDTFYDDPFWQMYDDEGDVFITDSQEDCAAAANPNVGEEYANFCVECQTSYLEPEAQITYVIPKQPVSVNGTGPTSDPMGVAFNGISFAPPAPTDRILGAYTLAPFDDCGGHVNLNVGYHYHEATGCGTQVAQSDGHAPMIGYALDGIPFYAQMGTDGQEPTDLDECRGHTDDERGYHYHVASPGANQFVGCFRGEYGCALAGDGAGLTCDATQGPGGPPGGGPPGGRPGPPEGRTSADAEAAHTHAFPGPHDHH